MLPVKNSAGNMPINESQLNKALDSQTEKIQKSIAEANENFSKLAENLTASTLKLTETVQEIKGKLNLT